MSQPSWKLLYSTDCERVFTDETGVYAPEMEIAQEDSEAGKFYVYRFSLDRMKIVRKHLVCECYKADWPHPVHSYEEWFAKDLGDIARSIGSTERELRNALCSEDAAKRARAYEAIGGYHGFDNLDSYPLILTEDQLNERWA